MATFDRRNFIRITTLSGGGLMLGCLVPGLPSFAQVSDDCEFFQPNVFIRIDKKGLVTLFVAKTEMGQDVTTSLPMIIAEELECDFKKVKIEIAPFGTLKEGQHDVGGSQSIIEMWDPLRRAGSTAKAMLIAAAAKRWNIRDDQCAADQGTVVNTITKDSISYGDLVCLAAQLPVPSSVTLKNIKDFKLIGKAEKKSNLKEILTGKAKYGIDIKVPEMVFAVVERCPVQDGTLISFNDAAALKVPGVIKVVSYTGTGTPMYVRAGVAVIATNTWAAMKARRLLEIKWNEGTKNKDSTDQLLKIFAAKAKEKPTEEIFSKGDINTVVANNSNTLTATYSAPFLAHATLEPVNFIAQVKGEQCEVWGGLQLPDDAWTRISEDCGFKKENIRINLAMMGGGFGRRLRCDFAIEAVKIAKQIDKPVKVIWDRTDDLRFSAYRPANYHRLTATWDSHHELKSWQHHVLSTSVAALYKWPASATEVSGANKTFWYNIPNIKTGYTNVDININRNWLRGVDMCVNVFAIESFIDEVALKLKKDPYKFRISLLEGASVLSDGTGAGKRTQDPARIAGVLKMAAEKIGWELPRKKNQYFGIACHPYMGTNGYGAHAFNIELLAPKKFRIKKVVAVIDCGLVVNPDGIKNQMEGGLAFALGQTLKSEITVEDSRVVQENFTSYEILTFDEMPEVEVYIIPSSADPGGVGEVAIPTVAQALCNALARAGYRPHSLPIKNQGFVWA